MLRGLLPFIEQFEHLRIVPCVRPTRRDNNFDTRHRRIPWQPKLYCDSFFYSRRHVSTTKRESIIIYKQMHINLLISSHMTKMQQYRIAHGRSVMTTRLRKRNSCSFARFAYYPRIIAHVGSSIMEYD
jgi:hypothetical protein